MKVGYNDNARIITMRFHTINEKELIDWLEAYENKQEYIKSLIREDMIAKYKGAIKNDK